MYPKTHEIREKWIICIPTPCQINDIEKDWNDSEATGKLNENIIKEHIVLKWIFLKYFIKIYSFNNVFTFQASSDGFFIGSKNIIVIKVCVSVWKNIIFWLWCILFCVIEKMWIKKRRGAKSTSELGRSAFCAEKSSQLNLTKWREKQTNRQQLFSHY